MVEKKTWFLAPDFSFFPDGELSLGSVIPHPSRPTAVLASLLSHPPPNIVLPPVRADPQPNHNHSTGTQRTFNFNLFTNVANMISGNTNIEANRHVTRSFGPVDLEVRSFNGSLLPDTIQGILDIPSVRKHVESSRWGVKRPVYVITGISVAKDSFRVTEDTEVAQSGSLGASGTVPAGPVPLEIGGSVGGGGGRTRTNEYDASAGVVFSFRCHVIQGKQSSIFASREGLYTGSGDEDEEDKELEILPATRGIVKSDLDEKAKFIEEEINGEEWIMFTGRK